MLPQKYRVRKKTDIERIFKKGRSIKEGQLILKTAPNELGFNRFGFIVSQKVSKKAGFRNKVKRKIRETVRLQAKLDSDGYDNLFIALPAIKEENIVGLTNTLLKKSKLIR